LKGVSLKGKFGYAFVVIICFCCVFGSFSVHAADSGVVAGVKSFQQYINNNLPASYLGTRLEIDGSAGTLTKAAAVKLLQYRLVQQGAGIDINGVFDTNTKNAYQARIGKIKRYDQGNWVYILQGLLYSNGYDPKGFDGSYGVSGGTGCLNAVNSFKSARGISEGGSGDVGPETMYALAWGVPPVNVQGGKLNFVVMSDAHISGASPSNYYLTNLKKAFWDVGCYSKPVSAILIAGDLTENGTETQYQALTDAIKCSPAQNLLLTMGNHDAGRDLVGGYSEAFNRFNRFCWQYSTKLQNASHPYYDRWINGYHFIVLCTERAEKDQAYLSAAQLAWFERKIAENAQDRKPIFVMCHQALNDTHPRTDSAAEQLGAQSEAVKKIISRYPQTIYLSGHTHNGFGYCPLINNGEGCLVHIPPLKGASYGYGSGTVLWYVRVHDDKVIFEARDFGKKQWLTQYNITID
jgi:predicted MPP superfamily phosphohydrolase